MTPKEKAADLVATFITETIKKPTLEHEQAKQCALICVRQINKAMDGIFGNYWQRVEEEIKKL